MTEIHLNNENEQHASAVAMGRRGGNSKKVTAVDARLRELADRREELNIDQLVRLIVICSAHTAAFRSELDSRQEATS